MSRLLPVAARVLPSCFLSTGLKCHNEAMRTRIVGVLGCLLILATGAVTQAQTIKKGKWVPGQLKFTQDGKKLLATYDIFSAKKVHHAWQTWDIESGRLLGQVVLPAAQGRSFFFSLFSPDGQLYAHILPTDPQTKTVIRDTATGKLVSTPQAPNPRTLPAQFSPDNTLLAGSSMTKFDEKLQSPLPTEVLNVWETGTGRPVSHFADVEENERATSMHFSQDNRLLVRLSWKIDSQKKVRRCITVFDRNTGKKQVSYFLGDKGLGDFPLSTDEEELGAPELSPSWDTWRFALSSNGQYLAGIPTWEVAMKPPTFIALWDMQTGALLRLLPLKAEASEFVQLHFSPDDSQLTAFGGHTKLNPRTGFWKQTWTVATGQVLDYTKLPIKPIDIPTGLHPDSPIFTTNSRLYVQFTNKNTIEIFSLKNGELMKSLDFRS